MVVGVGEEVVVPDDVALTVGDIDAVALVLIVDVDVIVEVIVPLNDAEGVPLAVPPKLRVLEGDDAIVEERLIVVDPLLDTVPLPVSVELPEPLPDGVTVTVMLDVGVIVPREVEGGVDVGERVRVASEESVPESVPEVVDDGDSVTGLVIDELIVEDGLAVIVVEVVIVPVGDPDELGVREVV